MLVNGGSNYEYPGQRWVPKLVKHKTKDFINPKSKLDKKYGKIPSKYTTHKSRNQGLGQMSFDNLQTILRMHGNVFQKILF